MGGAITYDDQGVRSTRLVACVNTVTGAILPERLIALTGDQWTHPNSGGCTLPFGEYAEAIGREPRSIYRYDNRGWLAQAGVHVCRDTRPFIITNVASIAAQRVLFDQWSEQQQVATRYTRVGGGQLSR